MNASNPALANVQQSFNAVSSDGQKLTLEGGSSYSDLSESHLQGAAMYQGYTLLVQNRHDHDEGKLYIFSPSGEYGNAIHLPGPDSAAQNSDHKYNHPGGIQVIGDYLLIPIQTQDYHRSVIELWDLSPLATGDLNPRLVKGDLVPDSNSQQVGGVGIVDLNGGFLLAACNNDKVYFYQSASSDLGSTTFEASFEAPVMQDSASEVCLLRDTQNNPYLIAFVSQSQGASYRDIANLYAVDLTGKTCQLVASKHCISHSSEIGMLGVHFRWSAGLYFDTSGALGMLASQRVMESHCDINLFVPGST